MASPQLEHGFTRIAHEVLGALAVRDFSGAELRAVLIVLRLSWGFHKLDAEISSQKLSKLMGVSERYARSVLSELIRKGVFLLVRTPRAARPPIVRFVKDYERWKMRPEADLSLFGELSVPEPEFSIVETCGKPMSPELSDPDLRNPEIRISGSLRSGSLSSGAASAPRPEAIPGTSKVCSKDKVKIRSKDTRPVTLTPGPDPERRTSNTGGEAPEPPGTGRDKKTKKPIELTPFTRAAIDTLETILGSLSDRTRSTLVGKLDQAAAEHGEQLVSIALREATREVVFKRHNEGQVRYPASMALKLALTTHLGPARDHRRRAVAEIRKRGLAEGLRRVGSYRWQLPTGWAVPPGMASQDAFYLKMTPLVAYQVSQNALWLGELARQAGLPEGGAGPGPDLGSIGRDLNDC